MLRLRVLESPKNYMGDKMDTAFWPQGDIILGQVRHWFVHHKFKILIIYKQIQFALMPRLEFILETFL